MPFAMQMPLEGCSFPIAALPIESAHHGFKAVLLFDIVLYIHALHDCMTA